MANSPTGFDNISRASTGREQTNETIQRIAADIWTPPEQRHLDLKKPTYTHPTGELPKPSSSYEQLRRTPPGEITKPSTSLHKTGSAGEMPKPSTYTHPTGDMPKPSTSLHPTGDLPKPSSSSHPTGDMPKPSTSLHPTGDMPKPSSSLHPTGEMPKPSTSLHPTGSAGEMPKPSTYTHPTGEITKTPFTLPTSGIFSPHHDSLRHGVEHKTHRRVPQESASRQHNPPSHREVSVPKTTHPAADAPPPRMPVIPPDYRPNVLDPERHLPGSSAKIMPGHKSYIPWQSSTPYSEFPGQPQVPTVDFPWKVKS